MREEKGPGGSVQNRTQVRRLFRLLEACKTRCKKRPFRRGLDAGPEAVTYAFDNRAKPDAKSDDFGAVCTQVRRLGCYPPGQVETLRWGGRDWGCAPSGSG